MPSWNEVREAVPDLAAAVQEAFDAHKHKVLATLRADGSPRLSGNEATFRNGDVWLGMMLRSRKALDLLRDPRMELHSAPVDEELKLGDARLAGRAVEITDAEVIRSFGDAESSEPFHLFRVDVTDITLIKIGDPADHLVIESWSAATGYKRIERR